MKKYLISTKENDTELEHIISYQIVYSKDISSENLINQHSPIIIKYVTEVLGYETSLPNRESYGTKPYEIIDINK